MPNYSTALRTLSTRSKMRFAVGRELERGCATKQCDWKTAYFHEVRDIARILLSRHMLVLLRTSRCQPVLICYRAAASACYKCHRYGCCALRRA